MDDSELRCPSCAELFDLEVKVPKVLHEHCSFCASCLKGFPVEDSTVICPDCHVKIKLDENGVDGLKDNTLLIPLIKMYKPNNGKEKSKESSDEKPAESIQDWCLDCNTTPEHACRVIHDVLPVSRAKTKLIQMLELQKKDCIGELNRTANVMSDIKKTRDCALLSVQAIEAMLLETSKNTLAKIEEIKEKAKKVEEFQSEDFQELVELSREVENVKLENVNTINDANRIGAIYRAIMETEAQITFSPTMSAPTLSIPMRMSSIVHRSQIYKNLMTLCCLQEIVDNNMMGVTKKDIARLHSEKNGEGSKVEPEKSEKKETIEKKEVQEQKGVNGVKEANDEDSSESGDDSMSAASKPVKNAKTQQKKNKKKRKEKKTTEQPSSLSMRSAPGAYKPREPAHFLQKDRPYNDVFPSTHAGYPPAGMTNPHLSMARGRGRGLVCGLVNLDSRYPREAGYDQGYVGSYRNGGQGLLTSSHSKFTQNRPASLPRNPESKVRVFLDFSVDKRQFGCVIFLLDKVAAPRMVENFVALCNSSRFPTYRHTKVAKNHPMNYILAGEAVKDETFSAFGGAFEADASPLTDCAGAIRMKCIKTENKKVMVGNLFSIWVSERDFKNFSATTVFGHVNPDGMETIRRLSQIDSWKAEIRIHNCGLA